MLFLEEELLVSIGVFSDGFQGGSIERSLMDPSEGSTNTGIWAAAHMFLVLTSILLLQVELEILMEGGAQHKMEHSMNNGIWAATNKSRIT